jgi:long-chain acyl-CoA synthetase
MQCRFRHLYEIVQDRARRWPAATTLGSQQGLRWHTLDSQELLRLVDGAATELAARGVVPGDRVVTWLPSHWRTPVFYFAFWKLGAILVPFDREMNPTAAQRIIDAVEPRLTLVGHDERPEWTMREGTVEWWEPSPARVDVEWTPPAEELAAIFYTSGTTGNPKGCMITHANLCSQVDALANNIPVGPDSRLASILPLSHLFELTGGLLYPLAVGAAIHYIPSRRGPDIVRVLKEQRVTHMIAVPQLFTLMGQTLEAGLRARLPAPTYRALCWLAARLGLEGRRRLFFFVHAKIGGHVRMMASGGAALPESTQRLWEMFGVRIVQGYGTSECSPIVACGAPDGSTPVGSVGKAIQGVEVRLSPEGELQVRGPNVMRGYWRDPGRTAEVLKDGWYSTGDLATIDARGNIRLAGRAKELIVLPSGMNVWPQDVEDALRADPHVGDAVVLLVPNATGGAALHAYLIPRRAGDSSIDARSVVARANAGLAQHQRVATATWWMDGDFPRTPTMKVRRHLLPMPSADAQATVDPTRADDDPVGQLVAATARVAGVRDDQTLTELGIDSLGLVDLVLQIEQKLGRVLGDDEVRVEMTVEQLRQAVTGAPTLDEAPAAGMQQRGDGVAVDQPLWPYTWGRRLRWIGLPFDLLYRWAVPRTIVVGGEHVGGLPTRVMLAGTHHSFGDHPLLRRALVQSGAEDLERRLVVAAWSGGAARAGVLWHYAQVAWGLYALQQERQRDASLRGLVRLGEMGNAIVIFPQGRHVTPEEERANASSAQFKPGVAVLAHALDAAVLPFGTAGTERAIPAHLEHHRGLVIGGVPVSITRGPLAIAFGPPLRLEANESPHEFTRRLQTVCFELAERARIALGSARG